MSCRGLHWPGYFGVELVREAALGRVRCSEVVLNGLLLLGDVANWQGEGGADADAGRAGVEDPLPVEAPRLHLHRPAPSPALIGQGQLHPLCFPRCVLVEDPALGIYARRRCPNAALRQHVGLAGGRLSTSSCLFAGPVLGHAGFPSQLGPTLPAGCWPDSGNSRESGTLVLFAGDAWVRPARSWQARLPLASLGPVRRILNARKSQRPSVAAASSCLSLRAAATPSAEPDGQSGNPAPLGGSFDRDPTGSPGGC